jgi:eukaryotic-like serine/threonine-protein kinase
MRQLTWFDRQGKLIGTAGTPHLYGEMNLSPDGNRVVVYRNDPGPDLWMIELDRGTNTRFTFNPANESYPVWSPDGSRVAFSSNRNGVFDLFQKSASGAGEEVLLFKSAESKAASDWSRDGRFLLYVVRAGSGSDLWVLPLEGERKPTPFLVTPFNETQARFSPDGHWVAYTSDESGSPEIYVRPFPASSVGKWQISTAGGQFPRWRRDGKELFYLGPDNRLMSADVNTNPSFKAGIPKSVIAAPMPLASSATTIEGYYWDVAPDGQRFLAVTAPGAQNSAPITVVANWQGVLKK